MPRRSQRRTKEPLPAATGSLTLNQIVAFNLRAARELEGWTQERLAEKLAERSGRRISQSAISALERSWEGGRKREFDVHELALFAVTLNYPILWFLLPPPNDPRQLESLDCSVLDLYVLVLGRNDQMKPMLDRLGEFGRHDPTPAEEAVEKMSRKPSEERQMSYEERRKELLMAVLDERAKALDEAAEELGSFFDHLRQVGIRGFIAEHTHDGDYGTPPENRVPPGDSASSYSRPADAEERTLAPSPGASAGGAIDTDR